MLSMKKSYVPITLDNYLNESRSIMLKRGYGERKPVVVGTNAPVRNQILSFVKESMRVSHVDLKKFIAGLNENNANPNAAATMWLKRNSQYFIAENKNGKTFYKLSNIGERLLRNVKPNETVSESIKYNKGKKINEYHNSDSDYEALYWNMHKFMPQETETGLIHILNNTDTSYTEKKEEIIDLLNTYVDVEVMNDIFLDGDFSEFADYILQQQGVSMNENKTFRTLNQRRKVNEGKFDFKDPKTKKPGLLDDDKECEDDEECETNEALSDERKQVLL